MTPPTAALFAANEATWPAFRRHVLGGFTLREGRGGGHRVSSATAHGPWAASDLPRAEAAMAALGQTPLFMIRAGDGALDAALEGRGYRIGDPTLLYLGDVAPLAAPGDPARVTAHWPPGPETLAFWARSGIGPERVAVMHRACAPRAALLAQGGGQPAGAAFVAVHQGLGMLHALAVSPEMRRQGTGAALVRAAAGWAGQNGARWLGLAVTAANAPARGLYAALGLLAVGQYHYRERAA